MFMQTEKIPTWKKKKMENQTATFDSALNELGVNGAFLNSHLSNTKKKKQLLNHLNISGVTRL